MNDSFLSQLYDKYDWEVAEREITDTSNASITEALASVNVENELKISVTSILENRCRILQGFVDALGAKKDWSVVTNREVVRREKEDINTEEVAFKDDKHKRLVWTFILRPHDVSKH